jgi:hypothetical protein
MFVPDLPLNGAGGCDGAWPKWTSFTSMATIRRPGQARPELSRRNALRTEGRRMPSASMKS